MNSVFSIPQRKSSPMQALVYFSSTLLRANLRDIKGLAITMGMPIFMLFSIWVPAMTGDEESLEIMQLLFPAIILLSAIMPGLTQSTRITRWREQHIFKRFALTPVPLSLIMIGAALTQTVIGIVQGIIMLFFGVFLVGLNISLYHILLVLGAMALSSMAFISFGSMISSFIKKSETAGYIFFFSIMPLTFLASFPPEMMSSSINAITPWLPTSMAIELIGPIFLNNQISETAWFSTAGLLLYATIFIFTSILIDRMKTNGFNH